MSYDTFTCLNVCYGGLPQEMICKGCMETNEKAIRKGICLDKDDTRTTRTTCQQPFHSQWKNHYHQKKQLMFARTVEYLANASEHLSASSDEAPPLVQDDDKNGNSTTSTPIIDNANKRRVLRSTSERLQKAIDAGRDAETVDIILAALTCNLENLALSTTNAETTIVETTGATEETTIAPTRDRQEASRKRSYQYATGPQTVGKHVVENVPLNARCILQNYLSKLLSEAEECRRLKAALSHGKFSWGHDASHYLGLAFSQVPTASHYAMEQALPLIFKSLFVEARVDIPDDKLASSTPKQQTIGNLVKRAAATVMVSIKSVLHMAKSYALACDKGHRSGVHHFVKLVSIFDFASNCVHTHQLDIDGAGGTTEDGALAIKHSIETTYGGIIKKFSSGSTDAGGSAVSYDLKGAMHKVNLVNNYVYFVITCALHGLQLGFKNGVEKALGAGKVDKSCCMQLLHSLFDMQKKFPNVEFKLSWNIAQLCDGQDFDELSDAIVNADLAPNRVAAAVLTRWWYVNQAALHLKTNWDGWLKYAKACLKSTTSDTASGQIASSIIQMMGEHRIKCDVWFINSYSQAFFIEHFKWLQSYDSIAKDFGYLSRHMFVRTFIMIREMEQLQLGWEMDPHFKDYIDLVNELPEKVTIDESAEVRTKHSQEHCKQFVADFFNIAIKSMYKHFNQWRSPELAVMALGGDNVQLGTALAAYTLNGTLPSNQESTVVLPEHGNKTVKLSDLVEFLSEMTTSNDMKLHVLVKDNLAGVRKMSQGEHLWSSNDPDIMKLAMWVKTYVVPAMHQTHRVEAGVGAASHCSYSQRTEGSRSRMTFLFTEINNAIRKRVFESENDRVRRANCHMSGGKAGSREHKSKASKTKHKSDHETPPEGTIQYATGSTPRGTIRIKHLLAEAASLHVTVVTRSNEIDEQVKVFDSKKFLDARVAKKMGEFAKAQQKPDRAPNARERRVGVMMTPLARRRVPLGRNLPANLYRQALIDECNVRGIDLEGTTNYTMITKALREWNKANGEDEKSILPRTAHFDEYFEG